MTKDELYKEILNEVVCNAPRLKKIFHKPDEIDNFKLTSLQFMAIHYLSNSKENGIPMNKLSSFLGISKQQTTRLVDSIVSMGYIERYWNPDNRREVLIKLTPAGHKQFQLIREQRYQAFIDTYSDLSEEDLEAILDHIKAIKQITNK